MEQDQQIYDMYMRQYLSGQNYGSAMSGGRIHEGSGMQYGPVYDRFNSIYPKEKNFNSTSNYEVTGGGPYQEFLKKHKGFSKAEKKKLWAVEKSHPQPVVNIPVVNIPVVNIPVPIEHAKKVNEWIKSLIDNKGLNYNRVGQKCAYYTGHNKAALKNNFNFDQCTPENIYKKAKPKSGMSIAQGQAEFREFYNNAKNSYPDWSRDEILCAWYDYKGKKPKKNKRAYCKTLNFGI